MEKILNPKTGTGALIILAVMVTLQAVPDLISRANGKPASEHTTMQYELREIQATTIDIQNLVNLERQLRKEELNLLRQAVTELARCAATQERIFLIQERILHEAEKMESYRRGGGP